MGREKKTREIKYSYAIITEDSDSAPNYIKGLIKHLNGDVKSFEFLHKGSSPKNVQTIAKKCVTQNTYSKIFCVFDKDSHNNKGKHGEKNVYNDLKHYCTTKPHLLIDASSVPSFEYFLYLHFKYHDAPIVREGKDSASDVMVKKLIKDFLLSYEKGKNFDFQPFKDKIQTAVTNAQKSIDRYKSDNNDNPLTYMGEFYTELEKIIPK